MYSVEQLKRTVDKFVVVLVGAPRGTDTLTWIRTTPEQLRRTVINDSDQNLEYQSLYKHSFLPWGADPNHVPEFHVCCVTNEYDSVDRYVSGEDHTLGGLTEYPLFQFERDKITGEHNMSDAVKNYRVSCMTDIMRRHEIDSQGVHYSKGLKPINKDRWEKYHREHFSWCDSVNFSYFDHYETMNNWSKRLKQEHDFIYDHIWGTQWSNQYLHFEKAYQDNQALFDSLTENSVVLRMRWDSMIDTRQTMWDLAIAMFQTHLSNHYNGTSTHKTHHAGFDLSPLALVQGLNIIRGHMATCDYWHCFDGPGAQILGRNYTNWVFENYRERLPGIHTMDWSRDPDRKNNYWKYPESVIMEFLYDNGYTVIDCLTKIHVPIDLMSFATLITDQYRYTWYDWTDEEVERIKNAVEP
jgi:hypothetical protein